MLWPDACSLPSVADRRAAHRQRADGTVQLAPGPRPGRRSSCCGSRTPTASAPRRRTSSRSSRPCAGSGSTGTSGPSSSPSARERHAEVVQQLLAGGHAYRSTAGPDEVKAYKEAHGNRGFRGERRGRGRRPAADARRGRDGRPRRHPRRERVRERACIDDLVIARADGTPVYHLAVVVDDLDAGITHVVRGADHYSNTPKQMRILRGAGRRAAHLRPPAAAARARRQEALQAPRRGFGAGAARSGLPARGSAQLPRAARLGLRRGDDVLHRSRSSSSASRSSASRRAPPSSTSRSCAG